LAEIRRGRTAIDAGQSGEKLTVYFDLMRFEQPIFQRLALAVLFAGLSTVFAPAEAAGDASRGHMLAELNCATCHAIGRGGRSPYAPAPPFRTLHLKYDVSGLAEAFAEGIVVMHNGPRQMPKFVLEPDQIDDLIAYLKSLEDPVAPGGAPLKPR
jgi:mono/diheme cytochrome c family protein